LLPMDGRSTGHKDKERRATQSRLASRQSHILLIGGNARFVQ
jgi:hypothetical protein